MSATDDTLDETISKSAAAKRLGVSERQVNRMIAGGELSNVGPGVVLESEVLEHSRAEELRPMEEVKQSLAALRGIVKDLGDLTITQTKEAFKILSAENERLAKQNAEQQSAMSEMLGLAGDVLLKQTERDAILRREEQHGAVLQQGLAAVQRVLPAIMKKGDGLTTDFLMSLSAKERLELATVIDAQQKPEAKRLAEFIRNLATEPPADGDPQGDE